MNNLDIKQEYMQLFEEGIITEDEYKNKIDEISKANVSDLTNPKIEKHDTNFKLLGYMLGMIDGIVSIIFGIYVAATDIGSYVSSSSYGGDAYTGIQNAAATTANNVHALSEVVKVGFAGVLIVAGIALVCIFGTKYISEKKK